MWRGICIMNGNITTEVALCSLQLCHAFFFLFLFPNSRPKVQPKLVLHYVSLEIRSAYQVTSRWEFFKSRCGSFPDGGLSAEDSLILHSIGCGGNFRSTYQTLINRHWLRFACGSNKAALVQPSLQSEHVAWVVRKKKTNLRSLAAVILLAPFGSSCCKWM